MDIAHVIGADLGVDTTGDVASVEGSMAVRQRLLRRLMTNGGDYIWNPTYGGGLPAYVGRTVGAASIGAVVRDQLLLEATVARLPVPAVEIVWSAGDTLVLTITYTDAATGTTQSFTVSPGT